MTRRQRMPVQWLIIGHGPDAHHGALLKSAVPILISPVHPTRSHPDWQPLPGCGAAALAPLAEPRAIALGAMNRRRYAKVAALGFIGWAGISAFRT